MLTPKNLENFCAVVLSTGVNLQKGQGLEILCPIDKKEVAHALTQKAYEMGAKIVRVRWEDQTIEKLNFLHSDLDALCNVPKWFIDSKNELVDKGFCYVAIAAENPKAFDGVPTERLSAYSKAKSKALKKYFNAVTSNEIRWCVTSVPTKEWAECVFPNSVDPESELSNAIMKTMRLDSPNPVLAWQKHVELLCKRANFLNENDFDYLHFESPLGTDLKVGLAKDHVWLSALEKAQDGIDFIANLPTEEVFTAPHRERVNGIVRSAKPLVINGQIVEYFIITFRDGKAVNFTASRGYDALKGLIDTDKGSCRLGEVALIGKSSPIAQSGILFYNTLFDENASCHLALGKAYPTTVKNGTNLLAEQLKALGVNDSIEHEDFMIGTPDLSVTGVTKDGRKVPLFKDGDWII